MTYLGLTWDHPRGYDALAAAEALAVAEGRDPIVHWEKQPLEGFESAPIADLAARYDLIVMDHPHIGEAVAEGCLLPLEDHFDAAQIAAWERQSVGPSFASYAWEGRHWAVPLDVATQVMARRPDILATPPADFEAVLDLARHRPVVQSLAGPHAFLTLMSMLAGQSGKFGGPELADEELMAWALELMHRLYRQRPAGTETLNPIGLLEAMSQGDEIALVPLVFGYVTYASQKGAAKRIAFSDTIRRPEGRGGVLGGTGIAFSRRITPDRAVRDHVAWLMSAATQTGLIPNNNGQPSARAAWRDDRINAASGGFYRDTLATAEQALLRPRFDGFVAFQTRAADCIRNALATGENATATIRTLRALWTDARAAARGDLDDKRTGSR